MTDNPARLYAYEHYTGLWRDVDENHLESVADHFDLARDINEKQRERTPLFLACLRKSYDMIHFLLQAGADPNIECRSVTPLYLCCLYGESDCVAVLLEFGADPNALCTARKIAALHLAATKGIMTIVDLLLAHGAKVDICSPKYGTPLHVAVGKNHQFIARRLLEHGASPNAVNDEGETPLHVAARSGFVNCLRLLLNHPSLNASVKEAVDGNTALHVATLYNQETAALMLIAKNPDLVHVRNATERQSPMFYASDAVRRAIKHAIINKMPGFVGLVNSKLFSDLTFLVADRPVYAHRIIVMCRCPHLWQLVTSSKSRTVPLPREVEWTPFAALLHYLYTDDLKCETGALPKLTKLAERFHCERLVKLCMDATVSFAVHVPDGTFRADLQRALRDADLADVAFVLEGGTRKVLAHKCLLARHEFFRAMWSSGLKESAAINAFDIALPDLRGDVFDLIRRYSYCWHLPPDLEPDVYVEVLEATSRYMIDGLRHACENQLSALIDDDTVCQLYEIADTFKSLFLREECFDYMVMNYDVLKDQAAFAALPDELRKEITDFVVRQREQRQRSLLDRVKNTPRKIESLQSLAPL